ncbi:unnamed protein product, partial [Mesorhabditis spiculigera]
MVEVFVSGQIYSASGFADPKLCVAWRLQLGGGWRVVEGPSEGQTQVDIAKAFSKNYFSYPMDIHLATRTLQDWPRLNFEVWHHDQYGRQEIYGYGSVFLPNLPGMHEVSCNFWRPKGSLRDELKQKFIGGGLQVTNPDHSAETPERMMVNGTLQLKLNIITRHFDRFGIAA